MSGASDPAVSSSVQTVSTAATAPGVTAATASVEAVQQLPSSSITSQSEPVAVSSSSSSGSSKNKNNSKMMFSKGEKVFCYHGLQLYEAKIIDGEIWDGSQDESGAKGPHYSVHYKGWNSSWDEWVIEGRVLKITSENIQLKKQLEKAASTKNRKKSTSAINNNTGTTKGSLTASMSATGMDDDATSTAASTTINDARNSTPGPNNTTTPTAGGGGGGGRRNITPATAAATTTTTTTATTATSRNRKRLRDDTVEKEVDYISKPEIRLPLAVSLKSRLVDEWEQITKNQRLHKLPRVPSVNMILDAYKHHKQSQRNKMSTLPAGITDDTPFDKIKSRQDEIVSEVLDGLRQYFNAALGTVLLYRNERQQYSEILISHRGKQMADIYGAEHLLRLFVQLPAFLVHTALEEDAVELLRAHLNDLMTYIQKRSNTLFASEYDPAPTRSITSDTSSSN
ncbi:MRG-domain-containing protein [Ramicandelaber brevisporus]|nr:MRG-domain-containing protein [Ramicandelaber brevisporus]